MKQIHTLAVIARESGRSSIPEAAVIEPRSRGVLDSPLPRGMTPVIEASAPKPTRSRMRSA